VFNNVTTFPATVDNNGGLSAYGTRGQGGNVWEWQESAFDGVNDSPSENRAYRDGSWVSPEISMRSTERLSITSGEYLDVGFRVASVVPEPTSVALLGLGAVLFVTRRRRSTVSMASVLTRTL
jgi:hypothetical protein